MFAVFAFNLSYSRYKQTKIAEQIPDKKRAPTGHLINYLLYYRNRG